MTLHLSDILKTANLISYDQWHAASNSNEHFFDFILKLDSIDESEILSFISSQLNIPFKVINNTSIDHTIKNFVPESLARKHSILPLFQLGNIIYVAVNNPFNMDIFEELECMNNCFISVVLSPLSSLLSSIDHLYSYTNETISDGSVMSTFSEMGLQPTQSLVENITQKNNSYSDKIINSILNQSISDQISDIYIEPDDHLIKIKFRINGVLKQVMAPPKKLASSLILNLKKRAQLDISESLKPQDGFFTFNNGISEVNFRVSTLGTISGEKILLRLIDKHNPFFGLELLSLSTSNTLSLQRLLDLKKGLILFSGSSYQQKVATMYTFLEKLNMPDKNIVTVENPVSSPLQNIHQLQINPKIGLNYVNGLSAALNQKPDIIMIDEIQDIQTANLAFEAASNDILILSSVASKTCKGTLSRLLKMGIQPFLINKSVVGLVNQESVKQICPRCKTTCDYSAYSDSENQKLLQFLKSSHNSPVIYKGTGCDFCANTGYRGYLNLFDVTSSKDDIKRVLSEMSCTDSLSNIPTSSPVLTDGIEKLLAGLTTLDEISPLY